ncbi:sulfite reductase (NADPH) hemoprotein beta-component [Enhydrobacter aerosaccus]|uniref:Sulfite reductase (NADPH) hemoprotein beta-component n=1 Tax=Enhydrobacter aerosaccus TaxID=225324 RepID=A0A1T4KGK4_9HYPH|nr:nitrite/sulfite reductase [Enhydrobacter aerosaccus]SJZ41515.1 sulfite reductase (NADPH) hemoprotein beta-component [Enhydrobacter aerosaccus]
MPDTHFYRYDDYDRSLIAERVEQFRDQVRRRLAGELTEEQFKPLRLTNGLYLQLHAYMLRIAIPYGTLSSRQLRKLADIARRFDRGYGHFTTRQNLQLNWIKLEDAPDALAALAEVDMHAIQTSGNLIRNVTADHFAGAAVDEIEDPRIWCEIIRQWSTFHPEFSFLPRKFKIAITGSPNDRAAVRVHDVGLRLWRNDQDDVGFEVIVGGGLGRTPLIGKTLREFLPKEELLAYLEATLRVYNRYGRRDNLYKSRIKILVHEVGVEKVREEVEAEFAAIKDGALKLAPETIEAIARQFAPPPLRPKRTRVPEVEALKLEDRDFALWLISNTAPHRVPGHAIVTASLKPAGAPPGDASAVQMEGIADIADRYSQGEIRVSHEQNLVLPHVAIEDLPAVYKALRRLGFAEANVGKITDIIACPGLDYCALANARSIPVAQRISLHFAELARQHDIGDLKIKISGCINACGHHHVGHIGILGVDKNGVELYQISLGGDVDFGKTTLGTILGPAVAADKVVEAVDALVATYLETRRTGERFVDTYRRIGAQPFKDRVYGAV